MSHYSITTDLSLEVALENPIFRTYLTHKQSSWLNIKWDLDHVGYLQIWSNINQYANNWYNNICFIYRRNHIVLDIYYEELSFKLFEEQKALTLSGLISKFTIKISVPFEK